jgi:hypothetical protein
VRVTVCSRVPLNYARRHPSAVLLVVQLAAFLLYPWMERSPQGRALLGVFGLIVLGLVLRVIRRTSWNTWVGWVVAMPVIVMAVISLFAPRPELAVAMAALEAAVYFYAAGSLITYMLQDLVTTTDELFAAGATFTLVAWAFAFVFLVQQWVSPGSFVIPGAVETTRSWMELLYLSVITLSSVGLSDVVPATPMARGIIMLEAFIGVMYMALVVSRLTGLLALKRERATHEIPRVPRP